MLVRPEPDDDWCARQRAQVATPCWNWALLVSINVQAVPTRLTDGP